MSEFRVYQPASKTLLRYLESRTTKDLKRVLSIVWRIIQKRKRARELGGRQPLEPKPLTPKQIYHKWRSEEGRKKAKASRLSSNLVVA